MHRHILIPSDGTELSEKAVVYGIALAKAVNAKVTGLTISTPLPLTGALIAEIFSEERTRAFVDKCLGQVRAAAARADINCDVAHVEHEHAYQAIIDTAKDRGCDLIVMASHGRRGVSAIVLGSETVKVLTHSDIPVLVYREPRATLFPPYFAAS